MQLSQFKESKVLVVDDSESVLQSIRATLRDSTIRPIFCRSAEEALGVLEREEIDLAISDIRMPTLDGYGFLDRARAIDPDVEVIFLTGFSSVEDAVSSVRRGATDYLTKPFSPRELLQTVQSVLARRRGQEPISNPRFERAIAPIIGRSPGLLEIFPLIERFSVHSTTVLIRGESGTGKELVARALHDAGPRAERPYVVCNCSAFSETLLENEIFGHARGAFTDADESRPGVFESADSGVLFLDEIGDLPFVSQAKLLRVLETGEVQRIGETSPRRTDVQVVAATNKDLATEVEAGRFRKDLYFRLNVAQIHLPPLRDRVEDVPLLVERFLDAASRELGKPRPTITTSAEKALAGYHWPGNVRELRNVVFRALLFQRGTGIGTDDLPEEVRAAKGYGGGSGHSTSLDAVRREHIRRVLEEVGGNKSEAAQVLGVSRVALYREIRRYGL